MAEQIDLPFGLWTLVGRRKHKFNHIRQIAPMCRHGRAHWHHLANTIELSVCGNGAVLHQITLTTYVCMSTQEVTETLTMSFMEYHSVTIQWHSLPAVYVVSLQAELDVLCHELQYQHHSWHQIVGYFCACTLWVKYEMRTGSSRCTGLVFFVCSPGRVGGSCASDTRWF